MAEFPAMMLWTDAYLADTTHLRTEEHGAYLLLLMAAWRSKDGALTDDDAFLARVCRCTLDRWRTRMRPIMEPFFTVSGGRWTQKRLQKEREHLQNVRAKRSAAAHAKHLKDKETASAHAGANGVQSTTTPTSKILTPNVESDSNRIPDSAPAKPTRRARKEYPVEFEQLWSTYPVREEDPKDECFKHWRTVTKSVEPSALLVAATAYHAEHHDNEFRFGLRRWLSKHLYRNPVPKRRQTQQEDVIGAADRMSKTLIRKVNGHGDEQEFAGTHSLVPNGPPPSVWSRPEDDAGTSDLAEWPIHRSLIGPAAGNA